MPHKHKRKRQDENTHDLPPNVSAHPLPVGKTTTRDPNPRKKQKQEKEFNDAPAAFRRLMQYKQGHKPRSGLDNGDSAARGKKRKANRKEPVLEVQGKQSVYEAPKILPGERLKDFSARVDQAIPVAGLTRKVSKGDGQLKGRKTKAEKKMQRIQTEWRKQEDRRKEKKEEERDLAEEREAADWNVPMSFNANGAKKGKRGHMDEDPWQHLKSTRRQATGLNDVVQVPPDFKKMPTQRFKVKNNARVEVANVPNAAGSLRRREELGESRQNIIDNYRKLMKERRKDG